MRLVGFRVLGLGVLGFRVSLVANGREVDGKEKGN